MGGKFGFEFGDQLGQIQNGIPTEEQELLDQSKGLNVGEPTKGITGPGEGGELSTVVQRPKAPIYSGYLGPILQLGGEPSGGGGAG